MLITKVMYENLDGFGIKGVVNNKKQKFLARVVCDSHNIEEAIENLHSCKYIAGIEYMSDPMFLKGVDTKGMNVFVRYEVEDIDEQVDKIMTLFDENIKVVFKLPETFEDMKKVYDYSQKYKNISFCGGHFLRIKGCNLGCICNKDLNKPIAGNKIGVETTGCSCVIKEIPYDSIDDVTFMSKAESMISDGAPSGNKSGAKKSKKKVLSSLFQVPIGVDNF